MTDAIPPLGPEDMQDSPDEESEERYIELPKFPEHLKAKEPEPEHFIELEPRDDGGNFPSPTAEEVPSGANDGTNNEPGDLDVDEAQSPGSTYQSPIPVLSTPFPELGHGAEAYEHAMTKKELPETVQQMMSLMPPEVIAWMQGKGEAPPQIRKMMTGIVDRTNWFIAYSCMTMMAQMAKLQNYLDAVQSKVFDYGDVDMADPKELKANWYGITEQMVKLMDFTRKFVNQSQHSLSRLGADASNMQQILQSMNPADLRTFKDKLLAAKKAANDKEKARNQARK